MTARSLHRLLVALVAAIVLPGAALAETTLSPALQMRIARGGRVPSIVTTHDGRDATTSTSRHRGRLRRHLTTEAAAVDFDAADVAALARDSAVAHVALDLEVRGTMDTTTGAIAADQVWPAGHGVRGYTGRGVGIALIDSGVGNHPDVASRVVAQIDFTESGRGDPYGHGTHLAGIIAGSGRSSLVRGQFRGVASGAHIVSLRVLDETGSGQASDVIAAIEWAIRHRRAYGLRVINLSLGHPVVESYRDDPLNRAVQRAVRAGLVVVTSAGNAGQTPDGVLQYGGILTPANDPHVITVGAADTQGTVHRSDDVVAPFSSRGPTLIDGLLKPDLIAPGRRITSTSLVGSTLATLHPDWSLPGRGAAQYQTLSGTSMSAAVVTGAVALMLEASPSLGPAAVKAALQYTAEFQDDWYVLAAGTGHLNAAGAVTAARALHHGHPRRLLRALHRARPQHTIVAGETIAWGTGLVWSNEDNIVWSNDDDNIVWSNDDNILWSNDDDNIVWSNDAAGLIWSNGSLPPVDVIWGNGLVWSNTDDNIVWSNGIILGTGLVWSNGLLWSNGLIWSNGLVWSNDDDNIVWSNELPGL